jgi:hypothetical protein
MGAKALFTMMTVGVAPAAAGEGWPRVIIPSDFGFQLHKPNGSIEPSETHNPPNQNTPMKKLVIIAALLGTASLSHGQAYISFKNSTDTRVSVNTVVGTLALAGSPVIENGISGSYYFALLVAPTTQTTISMTTDPTLSGWTFTGVIGMNFSGQGGGQMNGNGSGNSVYSYNAYDSFSVPIGGYVANGITAANFAVVGWSANIGSTWQGAQTWWNNGDPSYGVIPEYFGISQVATDILFTQAGGPYNPVWGPTSNGQVGGLDLNKYAVPEPEAFALAGLGSAALFAARRRVGRINDKK